MEHKQALTDGTLMDRVRRGDEVAFGKLYRRHGQAVYAYLWRTLGDGDTAADFRQEVFMRLWRIRKSWDGGDAVRGFLIGAARNLVIDSRRRLEVRDRHRLAVAEHLRKDPLSPEAVLVRRELSARIDEAIEGLPPRMAEVFTLRRNAGLSYREIADLLGISPNTVMVHMGNALRRLREALADLREPDNY